MRSKVTNKEKPIISVIILSYNTKVLTDECLSKLEKSIDYLSRPVEVIVVENGTDGTGKLIEKKYPWVKLLEPKENIGFAKGNNLGLRAANKTSNFYMLLNTDAFVHENTLYESLKFMSEKRDCGLMGCKLVFGDGRFQPSAGYLPTPFSVITWALGIDLIPYVNTMLKPFHPNFRSFFKSDRKVGWVTGAFWFMRNQVIKKTHGFDENYFMYGEEIEWCKRIYNSGFDVWFTPRFEVTHLFSGSQDGTKNAFIREVEGIYYYMKKYYPNTFWIKPVIKIGMLARSIVFFLIGNHYRAKIHWQVLQIK